jgi:hypothetical protein
MYSSGISAPNGPHVKYDTSASGASYPHMVVTIKGSPVHFSRINLTVNAHGATDEGTITASLLADTDWSILLNKNIPDQVAPDGSLLPGVVLPSQSSYIDPKLDTPIVVTIDAGFSSDASSAPQGKQLKRLFKGLVDANSVSFREGTVEFEIRSLASVLIQDKIQTSVENMTTVAFINESAKRWGLTTDIRLRDKQQPETLQSVYTQRELVGIHNIRRWDLAKYCAQVDDVQIWESNGVIHYVEPKSIERHTLKCTWGLDIIDMTGKHSITGNKEIDVQVHSYTRRDRYTKWTRVSGSSSGLPTTTYGSSHSTSQADFGDSGSTSTSTDSKGATRTTVSTGTGGSVNSGATGTGETESSKEHYVYDLPNLSLEKCNARAIAIWRQISMHEYQATFDLAVTSKNYAFIDITTFFAISGTPYHFYNTKYWPRSINHTFEYGSGSSGGWRVKIDAVNHFLAEAAV